MKFKIYYTLPDGNEDDFIVEGDNLEVIRAEVKNELLSRGGTHPFSEEIINE